MVFIVRYALLEDSDKGWVYLLDSRFVSRSTIRLLRRLEDGSVRSVYCEYRGLDPNFVLEKYNGPPRVPIPTNAREWNRVLVISEYYRRALGGFEAAYTAEVERTVELEVRKPWCSYWADLRAACQHPEPGVRVATRVALLGTWLGVSGLVFALIEPLKEPLQQYAQHLGLYAAGLAVFSAIVCLFAGRGAKLEDPH